MQNRSTRPEPLCWDGAGLAPVHPPARPGQTQLQLRRVPHSPIAHEESAVSPGSSRQNPAGVPLRLLSPGCTSRTTWEPLGTEDG